VKIAWPYIQRKMETDFRLFAHARNILKAVNIRDEKADIVGAMFDAVGRSEQSVLAEFDLNREAWALRTAGGLCTSVASQDNWPVAYRDWLEAVMPMLDGIPPYLAPLVSAALASQEGWSIQVPEPLRGYCGESVMGMSLASGESVQTLLEGVAGTAGQQEAAAVLISYAVPFIGWLLLCKSTSHLAHVDPHPGNFRWDSVRKVLWVLDWGSHVTLSDECRRNLCLLITLVADNSEDHLIAETAERVGIRGSDSRQVATVIRGLLNASRNEAAQDTLNNACADNLLEHISTDVVPVVRCLGILGGMLKEMQAKIQDRTQQVMPLSLASLWKPFALSG